MGSPSNHPLNQPKNSVPDAEAKRQHDSWPTQGRLFEFPGEDSNCQDAKYCAYDFGEHIVKQLHSYLHSSMKSAFVIKSEERFSPVPCGVLH